MDNIRKLISKVRRILDTNSGSRLKATKHFPHSENINLRTDHRRFESFLRSINRCDSLLDARRLKNDIMGEIRRTRTLLGNGIFHYYFLHADLCYQQVMKEKNG